MLNSFAARAPSSALGAGSPRALRVGLRLAAQFLLLVGLFHAGVELTRATAAPLPGNLVGMLLLLALLRTGVVRQEHVEDAAALALQHLNLFFVPLAVGLMGWGGLLGASGAALVACLAGSMAVCLVVAGLVSQCLAAGGGMSDAG